MPDDERNRKATDSEVNTFELLHPNSKRSPNRRLNMNTKTKLAVAGVLFSAIASPAFAGDQDSATLLATSGRIIEPATWVAPSAYASAAPMHHRATWQSHWSADMAAIDRLAQGSH
jgi:hypothetical protein